MVDLLGQAALWLTRTRAQNCATVVAYSRPGAPAQSVNLAATPGTTTFEIDNGYGVVERIVSRDFLITASDLVLGGAVAHPRPGDCITESAANGTFVYEVMSPGKEPCWRWSDPYRNTIRVHTKQASKQVQP
jgi:hypothetical protein